MIIPQSRLERLPINGTPGIRGWSSPFLEHLAIRKDALVAAGDYTLRTAHMYVACGTCSPTWLDREWRPPPSIRASSARFIYIDSNNHGCIVRTTKQALI